MEIMELAGHVMFDPGDNKILPAAKRIFRKFSAVGCAHTKPLFENDTPDNRAKNRRVIIHFEVF